MSKTAPLLQLLLTPREACQALSVSEPTLRKLGIPRVMIGRAVRYAVADLQAWIEAARVNREQDT